MIYKLLSGWKHPQITQISQIQNPSKGRRTRRHVWPG